MNIILGPPGTGKTTTLLRIMEDALSAGMGPKKIGFISFTKRAIKEARDRVKIKFNLTSSQVQNFRTLHSFAFRHLGLSTKNLMTKKSYQEFADIMGIEITGVDVEDNLDNISAVVFEDGDRLLFLDGVARNTQKSIEETWEKYGGELDFHEVNRVHVGIALYKQQYATMDYTDLLELFLTEEFNLSFDLLLIDEAQDLSSLQWRVVEKICKMAKKVYIAGDDDQAIFRWAGADTEHFIKLDGDVQVLDHSYRLPKEIHEYAKTILTNIGVRREKNFNPADHLGSVNHISDIESLDFSTGSWLILARSTYSLFPYIAFARSIGLYYSFKEKGPNVSLFCRAIQLYYKLQKNINLDEQDYNTVAQFLTQPFKIDQPWHEALTLIPQEPRLWFKSLEDSGEVLSRTPRVQFSTIHGAKGAEADNVVICPDLSYKAYKEMNENPDDEARVFYVGVTRAKKNLYILTPKTRYYYDL